MLGVPTQVREYRKSSQNSQPFAVTGISSTYYGRIQNFRFRTLGVPVSNSDSREASQNSLTKFELRFFKIFFSRCDVYVWQLQHIHWEFQCNFMNFENILKIPLTFIKQMSLIHSIYRVPDRNWCSRCLKLDGRQQSLKERSCNPRSRKRKANCEERDSRKD